MQIYVEEKEHENAVCQKKSHDEVYGNFHGFILSV